MYTAMAKRRNQYLHSILLSDPTSINRNLQRGTNIDEYFLLLQLFFSALEQPVTDPMDRNPSILRPASLQPASFAPKIDKTKAELAYGFWGIRKLVKFRGSNKHKQILISNQIR